MIGTQVNGRCLQYREGRCDRARTYFSKNSTRTLHL